MYVCVSFQVQQLNAIFAKQCDECATVLLYQEQKQAALVLCMAGNGLQGIHLLLSHALSVDQFVWLSHKSWQTCNCMQRDLMQYAQFVACSNA